MESLKLKLNFVSKNIRRRDYQVSLCSLRRITQNMDSIGVNREMFCFVFVIGLIDKSVLKFANLIVVQ